MNRFFSNASDEDLFILTNLYEKIKYHSIYYYDEGLELLKDIVVPQPIIDFYKEYEPKNVFIYNGGFTLLRLSHILMENTSGHPGCHLIKCGVLTFAVTVGGNVIGMDLLSLKNNQPKIIVVDHEAFSYDEDFDRVEWVLAPREMIQEYEGNPIILTREILEHMPVISESFDGFLELIANDRFDEDVDFRYL